MPNGSFNSRFQWLVEQQQLRGAIMTPSSTRSSPLFVEEDSPPPSSQRPSKRRRTIKAEDGGTPDPDIPMDPAELSAETLKCDPKAGESPLPKLNREQHDTLKLIMAGRNIHLTGAAGCGKSAVSRWAIMLLRAREKRVAVTAPTGQAASQIGGVTYYSLMGWDTDVHKLALKEIGRKAEAPFVRLRLENLDVLFIDEISMVSKHMLDRINRALQRARDDNTPFGGLQVVLCGDFCQMPPIKPFETCFSCGKPFPEISRRKVDGKKVNFYECSICDFDGELGTEFWAFNSAIWNDPDLNLANVHLRENHRQSDADFMDILKKIRAGVVLIQAEKDLLRHHASDAEDGVRLFANKEQVKAYNTNELKKLPGPAVAYTCWDDFSHNPMHITLAQRQERSIDGSLMSLSKHRYDRKLELKRGMPVILMTNLDLDRGLVNGSHGTLVDFEEWGDTSIGSAGGIDRTPNQDIGGTQNGAHAYIARRGFGDYADRREEQVKRFMMQDANPQELWPVVEFANGRRVTIFASCSMAMLGDVKPYSLEMRTQIPLAPGWAMTFHKAQGATLEKVVVDLSNCFNEGMAYVALSRATKLSGMYVESLGNALDGVASNAEVTKFYKSTIWDVGGFR